MRLAETDHVICCSQSHGLFITEYTFIVYYVETPYTAMRSRKGSSGYADLDSFHQAFYLLYLNNNNHAKKRQPLGRPI